MHSVSVNSITKGLVSDDGGEVRMRFAQAAGGETEIAFPASMMQPIVLLASHLMAQAAEKRGDSGRKLDYVAAESWGMQHFSDGRVLLILTLPGGGNVSFALPRNALQQMIQIVDQLKLQASQVPEGATVN